MKTNNEITVYVVMSDQRHADDHEVKLIDVFLDKKKAENAVAVNMDIISTRKHLRMWRFHK